MTNDVSSRATEAARQLSVLIPYLPIPSLVDLAMIGNAECHAALALAQKVDTPVSAALTEMADLPELMLLIGNKGAKIASFSLIRMVERFNGQEALISAVEARAPLSEDVWAALASARLRTVLALIGDRSDPLAIDEAIIALLWASDPSTRAAYLTSFERFNRLTPQMVPIALGSGATHVAAAILAVLVSVPHSDVEAILSRRDKPLLARWIAMAGLSESLVAEFIAAVDRSTIKPSEFSRLAA